MKTVNVLLLALAVTILGWGLQPQCRADDDVDVIVIEDTDVEPHPHPVAHAVVMYIPNRVFDLLDIVRLRARVGPGVAAGVRVTEAIDAYLGAYKSVWVGLPGPRTEPKIPWPVGLEGRSGAELSVADATEKTLPGPNYQWDEIGADAQALAVGAAAGVSIAEAFDFVTGLLFIDISGDDL